MPESLGVVGGMIEQFVLLPNMVNVLADNGLGALLKGWNAPCRWEPEW